MLVLTMLVVAVAGAVFIFWAAYLAGLQGIYVSVASQWGGWALPRRAFGYPRAVIPYDGHEASLASVAPDAPMSSRWTQLSIAWPDPTFRCRVRPATLFDRFARLFDRLDGELRRSRANVGQLGGHWTAQSNHAEGLTKLLSPAVIGQLDMLRSQSLGANVEIMVWDGVLHIRRSGVLGEREALLRFVMSALQLYEQASLSWSAQIELIEAPASEPTEVICKICGEAITESAVACRACGTPHHRDCWNYSGACSVYGCGHTRFRRLTVPPGKLHVRE